MPIRAARSRLRSLSLVALALAGLATACKHPCEADAGTIPAGLNDAGLVVDGGTACGGGSIDPDPLATISECFVKNGEVANIEVYPYGHHLLGVIPRDGAVAYVALDPSDPYKRP